MKINSETCIVTQYNGVGFKKLRCKENRTVCFGLIKGAELARISIIESRK